MTDKAKKTTAKKKAASKKVTAKDRKLIVAEEANKLEKLAQKAALKAMTEVQLVTQVELSDEQKAAAKLLSSGYNYDEISEELGKKRQEVVAWMAQPAFVRHVNELTLKDGSSDKNERLRKAKRVHDAVYDAMMERIVNGDLKKMPIAVLEKILLNWSKKLDDYTDEKDDKTKKDLTVLILNHVQEKNGKTYTQIEDFLEDPEFKYPTIDVVAETVESEEDDD